LRLGKGLPSSLGDATASVPFQFRDNLWVESANLSSTNVSHSIRIGGESFHYSIINSAANSTVGVRGGFVFSGGLTSLAGGPSPTLYNAWADFLLGLPTAIDKDHQYIDPAAMLESSYGFYARDQRQVSRKLTLTYGLRYEIYCYSHVTPVEKSPGVKTLGLTAFSFSPNMNVRERNCSRLFSEVPSSVGARRAGFRNVRAEGETQGNLALFVLIHVDPIEPPDQLSTPLHCGFLASSSIGRASPEGIKLAQK
jgi:hypothetical protein